MNRKVRYGVLGGAVFLVVGLILGLLTGMNIGGNYFPAFEWGNSRGYEATGYIGAIVGGLVGLVAGVLVGVFVAKKRN